MLQPKRYKKHNMRMQTDQSERVAFTLAADAWRYAANAVDECLQIRCERLVRQSADHPLDGPDREFFTDGK